jgi:hypothetical protein
VNAIAKLVEINRARCRICGSVLGAHSHDELRCPNPADRGPLFLETKFKAAIEPERVHET